MALRGKPIDASKSSGRMTEVKALLGLNVAAKRRILEDTRGVRSKMKLAKRKLDSIAGVKSHCSIVTNDTNMNKVENQLKLAASLAQIRETEKEEEAEKKTDEEIKLRGLAEKALEKLVQKNGEVGKLYKSELCALLFVHYAKFYFEKKCKKDVLTKALRDNILSNREALGRGPDVDLSMLNDGVVATAEEAAAPVAAP